MILFFKIANFEGTDKTMKQRIATLVKMLGQGMPIRPLHGFKLEFSTILGSFGLVTTYTIVMLQFRIHET